MSAAEPKQTPKKQRNKEAKSLQPPNGSERLKTVVRRLPPNLPEDIFWQSVQTWVTNDTVTWKAYYQGKMRKRMNKESVSSRAYIAFKNEDHLAIFSREYDGHLFRDKAGNESQAVVEFAPYQKIPTEKKKVDARNNTIEQDEDYISFLESLKNSTRAEPVTLETLIAASHPLPQPTTTPLLEALKAEKSAQKDKEAIIRNHAHYKDSTATMPVAKKEEAKKKAAAPPTAKPLEPGPTNKKAKKAATGAAAQKMTPSHDTQAPPPPPKALAQNPGVTPAPVAPRPRPPREPHGRQQPPKGVVVPPAPQPPTDTTQTNPEGTPTAAATSRRGRPVIGVDRHFAAALNGAGVVLGSGAERKKRDRDRDSGSVAPEASGKGKETSRNKDEKGPRAPVVPSILQRADDASGPVLTAQRPVSPRGSEGPGTNPDASVGRGAKRGRGRGRGGNRGG